MKYILIPIFACFIFITDFLWTLSYKQAKKDFLDTIEPDKFHYLK